MSGPTLIPDDAAGVTVTEDMQMEAEPSPSATDDTPHLSITSSADESAGKRKRAADAVVCVICANADIKYRCPRCERITCSLACCLAHKKNVRVHHAFECDGKRDRTKYIPMAEFQDADISSDFFFLQEISRSTSAVHLDVAVKPPPPPKRSKKQHHHHSSTLTVNPELPSDYLRRFPASVQSFVQQAKKRGIAVHLHAPGMSKHKANTSYYNSKENCLYWRLEVQFAASAVRVVEPKWAESKSLHDVVDKHLSLAAENIPLRTQLKTYCKHDPMTAWLFLLRKEFVAASTPLYYELDATKSLAENFRHLDVLEYPVVLVDLQANREQYAFARRAIEEVQAPVTLVEEIKPVGDVDVATTIS
ncbi:Aste57867_23879 [Aphanomyces stellatus]|uniref:Aste57867_23879 protein n=1 Tax=Aphanomyces stellatus TaxID=120398 RepID=A0A485LNZ8_9STRA|nr:hypothetical protein As57867_023806 [Aphanomyces stellatus]VFU00522.1 Aste57867_23879 [Aphanomyces stellatus]